jgi:hypothetical protein
MILALAADNLDELTGSDPQGMPARVAEFIPGASSTTGLRWAPEESVDLIGICGQWPLARSAVGSRLSLASRGRELEARQAPPAGVYRADIAPE